MKAVRTKQCKVCHRDFASRENKTCSKKCFRKAISESKLGEKRHPSAVLWAQNHPQWKGDKVGLSGLHNWVKRRLIKPHRCSRCNKNRVHDLANISQKYMRSLSDWEWLCRRCHMEKDGRLTILLRINHSRLLPKGERERRRLRYRKENRERKIVYCRAWRLRKKLALLDRLEVRQCVPR